MTKKITKAQALAALEEVVSGHEDYVYESPGEFEDWVECAYSTRDGQPSCIVGHVYAKLNPELFERAHEYEWRGWRIMGDPLSAFAVGDGPDKQYTTPAARRVLRGAQLAQDASNSWSYALEAAKSA